MFSATGMMESSVHPDCSEHTCCVIPYSGCHNSVPLLPWGIQKWIYSGSDLFHITSRRQPLTSAEIRDYALFVFPCNSSSGKEAPFS